MELTDHQMRVVQHSDGHTLCIAVAGSGKTTTLAYQVRNLLQQGSDPQRVMVMMFNKSAQLDFTAKLQKLMETTAVPEVRTYHSTGLRLLKSLEKWGLRAPCDHNPMSDKETELKVRNLLLQRTPDTLKDRIKSDPAKYIEAAISFINSVKSSLSTPDRVFEQSGYPDTFRFFTLLFSEFEQWRHDHRRITFTDMLYDTVCLINNHPDILPRITNKMDTIIVDEYQDTSSLQHQLIKIIAGTRSRVIAVGDPDQTIYEFAGANIDNILHHFEEDFSASYSVTRLTMPHTFRYGHSIALAASHLISHNKTRDDVICISHPDNHSSGIQLTQTDGDETEAILSQLKQYLASSSDNLALLVRVWAQAVPIELGLLEQGIDYSSEGPSLFNRPEIAAILAALELAGDQLRFMDSRQRGERLNRLFTLPHLGIKNGLIQQLVQELQKLEENYGKALAWYAEHMDGISDYQRKKLFNRAKVLQYLEQQGTVEQPALLLQNYIRRSELKESLESMSLNDQRTEEQLLAVDGFMAYLKQIKLSVIESCHHIETLQQKKRDRSGHRRTKSAQLTISSCHRAKGLEWPVVLIPGLTTKYWPFSRDDALAQASANELEAERRLLYVAMTRARKKLHLFSCKGDLEQQAPSWSDQGHKVSRFLREMQLKHILEISPDLQHEDSGPLLELINNNGLTRQSRRYLQAIKPEFHNVIQQAPSRTRLKKHNEQLQTATKTNYYAAKKTILASSQKSILATDPWQIDARIKHSIFGEGQVIEVNDSNFVILFAGHHGVKRFARNNDVRHLFERI